MNPLYFQREKIFEKNKYFPHYSPPHVRICLKVDEKRSSKNDGSRQESVGTPLRQSTSPSDERTSKANFSTHELSENSDVMRSGGEFDVLSERTSKGRQSSGGLYSIDGGSSSFTKSWSYGPSDRTSKYGGSEG